MSIHASRSLRAMLTTRSSFQVLKEIALPLDPPGKPLAKGAAAPPPNANSTEIEDNEGMFARARALFY